MFRIFISLIFLALTVPPAQSADVIGLSLPLKGRFGPVAERMKFGAQMAVKQLNSSGFDIELKIVDDDCDVELVEENAATLRQAGAKIVVGPICFKYAAALAQSLKTDGHDSIPVIAWNTRNPLLKRKRDFDKLPLYSLSVAPDAEARAVVEKLLPEFGSKPFALLDDGSVYGRSLADGILLLGEQAGLKPVIISNFPPLQTSQKNVLKRLERSGVEAVFIAAAPDDVATIARDMAVLNYKWMVATGESGTLLPFAPGAEHVSAGLLMVQPEKPNPANSPPGLKALEGVDTEAEPSLLAGYALVEIAAKSLGRNKHTLVGEAFSTAFGPIVFDEEGRAAPTRFILYQWDGKGYEASGGVTR